MDNLYNFDTIRLRKIKCDLYVNMYSYAFIYVRVKFGGAEIHTGKKMYSYNISQVK